MIPRNQPSLTEMYALGLGISVTEAENELQDYERILTEPHCITCGYELWDCDCSEGS